MKDNPAAAATSIAELKAYKFGAQVGTTSYDTIENVIEPDRRDAGLQHERRARSRRSSRS